MRHLASRVFATGTSAERGHAFELWVTAMRHLTSRTFATSPSAESGGVTVERPDCVHEASGAAKV